MKLVVAVDNEWGIGFKGELLARVRADLRYFQSLTKGNVVILGSKTLSTFPGGRVLKDRTNIVLSRNLEYSPDGAIMARSLDELFEVVKDYDTDTVFVIGGSEIYKQLLPYCDTAYVTKFEKSFEKDALFPNLDESSEWEIESIGEEQKTDPSTDTEPDMSFRFCTYKRKASVTIRPSVKEDSTEVHNLLCGIAKLHREGRPDIFGNLVSKYSIDEVQSRLSKDENGVFVAELNGQVVGYIFCEIIQEGDGTTLYIDDLCVNETARQKGVGTALMDYAASYGKEKNCNFLLLNVWEFNQNAVSFYEKYGFKTRKRYLELPL